MEYTKKFLYQSNQWYNDGLRRANIRDLSGAIISLKKSLQFNRDNIAARNLLGLMYFGQGEVGEALVEWIISKNIKSHENIADYYIKKVQETPSELETMNQAIKKYNQCLTYCQQDGEDLAVIQLKKSGYIASDIFESISTTCSVVSKDRTICKGETSFKKSA
ncbi:MAG: tetratricopeptide repeat protein [Coprococcus phoceensis]